MKTFLEQKIWLDIPQETRNKLVLMFAINKSEGHKMVDNKVVSDGVSQGDLITGITIGKMIDFLGSKGWKKTENEKLFDDLFTRVIDKTNEQDKSMDSKLDTPKPL